MARKKGSSSAALLAVVGTPGGVWSFGSVAGAAPVPLTGVTENHIYAERSLDPYTEPLE